MHPSPAHLGQKVKCKRSCAGKVFSDTDWNDTGAVGDEVSRRDMTSLVFVAPHVESELHGALGAELFTCAVLRWEERQE